jgi:hypothetical protein
MTRTLRLTMIAAALALLPAPPAHAQIDPANMVSGTTRIPIAAGPLNPPVVLYTVPADRALILTDFDYVFWSVAEPTLTSQIVLQEGSDDRWAWTAFLSREPVWEKCVARRFTTGILFGPGTQVILMQTTTSVSGGDECAVSWAGYLTAATTTVPTRSALTDGDGARLAFRAAPNPASESTALRFRLPVAQKVTLAVYDVEGRRVRTLYDGTLSGGEHSWTWNGENDGGATVARGTYFARLATAGAVETKKIVLTP